MRAAKYFLLQTKRFLRCVPFVVLLSGLLLLCLLIGFGVSAQKEAEGQTKYELGVVGDPSDTYLSLGMAALQNLDNTRFAIHLQFLDGETAEAALENGTLNAYIVVPDGFIDDAMRGDVGTLSFVTKPSAVGTVDYVKDELLSVISTILVESQHGAYAAAGVGADYADLDYGKTATEATLSYVDLILSRGKLYKAETLGVVSGLSLVPSVFCGVILYLVLLLAIGFGPVFAKSDPALHRLLASMRFGATWQVLCEYGAFLLALILTATVLFGLLFSLGGVPLTALLSVRPDADFFFALWLILAVFASMQFLLYEATGGIAAGVLSQFLCATALCYFSGCFYPLHFFPDAIQVLAPYLPTGAAHRLLSGTLTDRTDPGAAAVLIAAWCICSALTVLLRHRRQTGKGGDVL